MPGGEVGKTAHLAYQTLERNLSRSKRTMVHELELTGKIYAILKWMNKREQIFGNKTRKRLEVVGRVATSTL